MAKNYASAAERDRVFEAQRQVEKVFGNGGGSVRAHPVGPYMVVGMGVESYDGYDWSPPTVFNILLGPNDEWLTDCSYAVSGAGADYAQTNALSVMHTEIVNRCRALEYSDKIRFIAMPHAQSDASVWIQDLADKYGAESPGLFWR
jgi:hypothetical protein